MTPALDVAAVLTFGGARVAATAALRKGATGAEIRDAIVKGHVHGPLKTITVQDTVSGAPITVRTLPRNAYRAGRMQATDRVVKFVTHELERVTKNPRGSFPVMGDAARVARSVNKVAAKVEFSLTDCRPP